MAVVKQTFILLCTTTLAQIIAFSFQPLLKRLFDVSDFGQFHFYITLANFCAVFFTFKIEYFFYQIKIKRLFKILKTGLFFLTFLLFIIYSTLGAIFHEIFKIFEIHVPLVLMLFTVLGGLFIAIFRCSLLFSSLQQQYALIGQARVLRRLIEGIVQSLLYKLGIFGLIIGEISGNILFSMKSRQIDFTVFEVQKLKDCVKDIRFSKYFIRRNKRNILQKSFADVINIWSETVLVIAIVTYATYEVLGYFELASKLLVGPMALLSAALAPQIIGTAKRNLHMGQSSHKEYYYYISFLILFTVLIIIFEFFFLKRLIIFMFGSDWLPVTYYIKYIIYYILVQFIISPFGEILVIYNKVHIDSIWKISRAVTLSIILLPVFDSLETRLLLFSAINIFFYLIYATLIFKSLNRP